MDINELIRQCPGVGEWMADTENRLSYLEMCQPIRQEEPPQVEPSVVIRGLTNKERDELNQLKARMNYLESKQATYIEEDRVSKKRKGASYIYKSIKDE